MTDESIEKLSRLPEWSVGLLVVHGIGDQSAGQAVYEAAGPILDILKRYAQLTGSPEPQIQDADLRPTDGPARLTIGPIYSSGPGGEASTWLICEAHWANSFIAPSLSRMLLWSFEYGFRVSKRFLPAKLKSGLLELPPAQLAVNKAVMTEFLSVPKADRQKLVADEDQWTEVIVDSIVQAGAFTRRDLDEARDEIQKRVRTATSFYSQMSSLMIRQLLLFSPKLVQRFIGFGFLSASTGSALFLAPLGILLLPFILLSLILVALLSAILGVGSPFRAIRSTLERTVGDAFVLTNDPVGRALMLSSVRRTVEWTEEHCTNYVVVAHSQGTVIVERLFSSGVLARAKKIVVYGSAIGLLEAPSAAWDVSDKWVSYRTPNDPISPGPLRDLAGLADDPSKWDRRVRGWNRLSEDHTSYWNELETFVVEVVGVAAATEGTNLLAKWASNVAESFQRAYLLYIPEEDRPRRSQAVRGLFLAGT